MRISKVENSGMVWFKNQFKTMYAEPRRITRGKRKGMYEVIIRLFCGENGFRKRIVDENSLRTELTFN